MRRFGCRGRNTHRRCNTSHLVRLAQRNRELRRPFLSIMAGPVPLVEDLVQAEALRTYAHPNRVADDKPRSCRSISPRIRQARPSPRRCASESLSDRLSQRQQTGQSSRPARSVSIRNTGRQAPALERKSHVRMLRSLDTWQRSPYRLHQRPKETLPSRWPFTVAPPGAKTAPSSPAWTRTRNSIALAIVASQRSAELGGFAQGAD